MNIIKFINTLIEAPSNNTKRIELKEDLLVHGVSINLGEIRMKIRDKEYNVSDCTFDTVMRQSMA